MAGYVVAGRVIDAVSPEPVEDGMVITEGDRLAYVGGYEASRIPAGARVIRVDDGTVLPGFIDCHAHLCGAHSAGPAEMRAPFGDLLLGAAHEIGILLDAGFTGLRDMSRNGLYLARAVERGLLRGPHIFPGGRVLGITSGHVNPGGEISRQQVNRTSPIAYLVDGVEDCLRGVREQFREGARFIKICATGGVSSPVDNLDDVQFSPEEMRAIVGEAERHGTYVAAHCTTAEGTCRALEAGVLSVEHGVMADGRCIELMAERGATIVTTLSVSLGVANIPGLPDYMAKKARDCAEVNVRTIGMARQAGVRIALGTDYSNSKNSPYDEAGREFEAMTRAGLTPMEAIRAGTVNAAHLVKMSGSTGTLEVGRLADIVVVAGNPLEDIKCLCHKDNVKVVLKNGALEKHLV